MNWQEIISFMLVAITTVIMIRSRIKRHKLRKILPCAGDCNCTAAKLILLNQSKMK